MTKLLYQVPYCENWYALETNKNSFGNSIDVANLFWETGLFAAIDPGFIHHFTSQDYCVSDSIFSDQWGMTAVKACDAWNITTGSNQTKVAVVDKGVDVNHRELSHVNVAFSYDVMNLSSPAQLYSSQETDEFNNLYVVYHGTLVGGVILSNHNANRVAGLSPNASLINISHPLTHAGDSSGEKFAIAINQAVNHGARIINNSWGASNRNEFTRADLIESAIDNAILHDCIVVFSAGNSNTGPGMFYPSEYRPEILTVGAIKSNLLRWEYSTYGTHLDVVAPGEFIWSTNAYNQYYRSNGTSLAAPHVSGTAALMLSVNPNLSAQNVRDIIEQTAQKVGGYSYQPTPNRPNGTGHQFERCGQHILRHTEQQFLQSRIRHDNIQLRELQPPHIPLSRNNELQGDTQWLRLHTLQQRRRFQQIVVGVPVRHGRRHLLRDGPRPDVRQRAGPHCAGGVAHRRATHRRPVLPDRDAVHGGLRGNVRGRRG